MKTVSASPMECISCTCPYCGNQILEIISDMRDMTGPDIEEEGEMDCGSCGKTFKYTIDN